MLFRGIWLRADNAPAHLSQVAVNKARACGFGILQHPPYSPYYAPSDFLLFPEMKNLFQGQRFNNTNDVINKVGEWFQVQSADFYNNGIQSVKKCWENV